MKLEVLDCKLSVCKVPDEAGVPANVLASGLFFVGRTDKELSLVCETSLAPANELARDDGWRAFRIAGQLDFSLAGILARLSAVLADAGIGIFAVSTYNTDYILVKAVDLERALAALAAAGYEVSWLARVSAEGLV